MRLVAPGTYPASIHYWSELSWEAHTSYHTGLVISRALQGRHSRGVMPSIHVKAEMDCAGIAEAFSWWDSSVRQQVSLGGTSAKSVSATRTFQEILRVALTGHRVLLCGQTIWVCYLLPMGSHPTSETSRQGPRLPWWWHFKVLSLRLLGRRCWVCKWQEAFSKIYKGTGK